MRQGIRNKGARSRVWGSLTDMPPDVYTHASAVLSRTSFPRNMIVVLPYRSTKTGERRVWRFGGNDQPARRRRGVAIRLSETGPEGAA